jgi:hypothetical protein
MEFEYYLASGLAVLIVGISFLWNRINFIKKGNIAIATVVKLEMRLDSKNKPYYVPFFQFTSRNYNEIIYEHSDTLSLDTWVLRQKAKVAYKEGFFNDDHKILLLTFNNVFGLSTILLTAGIVLLIISGSFYWNVSGYSPACFILGSIAIVPLTLYIWANRFFNSLN